MQRNENSQNLEFNILIVFSSHLVDNQDFLEIYF